MKKSNHAAKEILPAIMLNTICKLLLFLLLAGVALVGVVAVVPNPMDPQDQQGAFIECRDNIDELKKALAAYAADHQGEYPEKLDQLVPYRLAQLPFCRLAQVRYSYQLVEGKPELRCSRHGQP